jgi:hypothetical protein
MRFLVISILAATLAGSVGGAQAQDKPALAPTRDVQVRYRLTGSNRVSNAEAMKLSFSDKDRKVRVDLFRPEDAKAAFTSIIYDQPANHVLTLWPEKYLYFEVPAAGKANPGLMLGDMMQYTRLGTATVLGEHCTEWHVSNGSEDKGTACVTDDGVVLRASRPAPLTGGIEATSLLYETPPDSIFQPDPGMRLAAKERGHGSW